MKRLPILILCVLIAMILSLMIYQQYKGEDPNQTGDRPPDLRHSPTHANVVYGPHLRNVFDIWLAESDKPTPLVVFFHGGGFRYGDKRTINPKLLQALLDNNISVASVNYRLTDNAPYPAPMLDSALALQTIRHHAAKYNIDPHRIGASGDSAGAGISMWLAFHDDLADSTNADPIATQSTRLSCAAVFAGQTSYDPRFVKTLFNTDQVHPAFISLYRMNDEHDLNRPELIAKFVDASPINHLTDDDVPVMLLFSQANEPLPPNSTGKVHIHHPKFGFVLKEKMDKVGIECVVKLREHYEGEAGRNNNPIQDAVRFFEKHLAPSQ